MANFCAECGTKLEYGATFCSECGTRVASQALEKQPQIVSVNKTEELAKK